MKGGAVNNYAGSLIETRCLRAVGIYKHKDGGESVLQESPQHKGSVIGLVFITAVAPSLLEV